MGLTHSEEMDKIAPALAQLQSKLGNVARDAENPHFRHGYTSLPAFLEAVRGPLGEHGFSLSQHPGIDDLGHVIVETFLLHESGQWLRSVAASPAVKAEPQAIGSAITYLRRYALTSVLNIAQDDDDAEQARPRAQRQNSGRSQRQAPPAAPPEEQRDDGELTSKEIGDAMREMNLSVGDVAHTYGIPAQGEPVVIHIRGLVQAGETLGTVLRRVALDRTARLEEAKRSGRSGSQQAQEETVDDVEKAIIEAHAAGTL